MPSSQHVAPVALTLDLCSGAYDAELIHLLVARRVPATLFLIKRWLDRNASATRELLAQPELFELGDHGTAHVPATVAAPGTRQTLDGMPVQPDVEHLQAQVLGSADRIRALPGRAPRYFHGTGAAYDDAGRRTNDALDLQIAGFSVNADAGATLPAATVAARLRGVKPGDIVIAHRNHPGRGAATGFAAALPELLARGLRFVTLSQAELVRIL